MAGNNQQAPVSPVVTIPGYKITKVLGKGGMAIVYLAIQESIGRPVALKILAPDHSDDSFTDRFLREARIVSQLAHPNIITIFDAGVHQGYHYMCMEYIPGKNLTQARDTLSHKQKIDIIKQIALALDYAGKKGYVHRDIKPENIMLHENGRAILTDFGIARDQDVNHGLTQTGKAIGTPYFMSPEQTKGLEVDHRSDIYGLGVVLFQAVAGYVPFDGPSIVTIGIKHISEPIPPLPPGMEILQPIINKCLSKDPAHRYQRASELAQALGAISEAQLDFIDAKARALSHIPARHSQQTQLEQASIEILTNSAQLLAAASDPIPKIRAHRVSSPLNAMDMDDVRKRSRYRQWMLIVLLLGLAAAGYYKQHQLKQFWQRQVQARITSYLPDAWRPRTTQIQASQSRKPPVTVHKPAVNPHPPSTTTISEKTTQDIATDIEHYKKRLRINPNDSTAHKGIQQARVWYRDHLEQALADKDVDNARRILASLRRSFPRISRLPALAHVEQRIQQIEQFKTHLEQARVYMAANAVIKPDGANALEEYLAASSYDPKDPSVRHGLQDIAVYFYKKAKAEQADNKLSNAVDDVTNGLLAVTNDPKLLALKRDLQIGIQQQHHIKQMLHKAQVLVHKGQVIDPAGDNAYQVYRAILTFAPHDTDALNGLHQVQLWLLSRIHSLYDKQQYLQARTLITRAKTQFPDSTLYTALNRKINKAIDATYPKITRIVFSAKPVTAADSKASLNKLAPGQTLYARFAFKNFYTANTTVIARLKDDADHALYDEQRIKVTGRNGQGQFALHLPKPGSLNGNYNVELYMDKAQILKARLSGLN